MKSALSKILDLFLHPSQVILYYFYQISLYFLIIVIHFLFLYKLNYE